MNDKDFKQSMDGLPQELERVYGKAWQTVATLDDLTAEDARRHRETAMKQIRVTTTPDKTAKGVVHDFSQAVLSQESHLILNRLYWFGSTAVRFYVRAGKTGADFYKPHQTRGFVCYRINTKGERTLRGWATAEELLRL